MSQIYDAFDIEYRIEYFGLPVHSHWKKNIRRWTYYSDSYNGGNDFRAGMYLTKYVMESDDEYHNRIKNVALDNHCKSVVETYNSFLFRQPPKREYGALASDPNIDNFYKDADLDGRSFDAFMRDVSTYSSVYGHCWVAVDKPKVIVSTRAEELQQGIRPYLSLYTPENVLDWKYMRRPSGVYELVEITILDGIDETGAYFRTITPESTRIYQKLTDKDSKESAELVDEIPNSIGRVPFVCVYAGRSTTKGIGISDISDLADMQRAIYNELSELEQLIRISNHPSLVKTTTTRASAGAGAIIDLPDDIDPNLKPFLLEPNGSGISQILESIEKKIDSINRMANMGGTRSTVSTQMSGIALETEFQLLNARLSQKADNLELAEEKIWDLYAAYQGIDTTDLLIDYPDSFNIHDKANTIQMLKTAKEVAPQNPELLKEIDNMLASALVKDEDRLAEIKEHQQDSSEMEMEQRPNQIEHDPVDSAEDLVEHMMEMIKSGMSKDQIIQAHPELAQLFNNNEGQA